MSEVIFLERENNEIPYGFKIQGGTDFSVPLSILQVTPNSIADKAGLKSGDAIVKINDHDTCWMEHSKAKMELIRSGNDIRLTVERGAVDITKPQPTPIAQLKPSQPVNVYANPTFNTQLPPLPKTDLTVEKPESILIGSSHNRAPMPFNAGVGTTLNYKAAKPSNWQPGDYTNWAPEMPQAPEQTPKVKAIFHNQYNTPIGLYSDPNVFQEFQNQTRGIMPEINPNKPNIDTTSTFENPRQPQIQPQVQQQQVKKVSYQPQAQQQVRGANSLSMRMLNDGINLASEAYVQPPSVFDLKNGENPFGASVPRGFRSVQAPTSLPPDQRHAPMRKEYEVKHVKQNWIEPKLN